MIITISKISYFANFEYVKNVGQFANFEQVKNVGYFANFRHLVIFPDFEQLLY